MSARLALLVLVATLGACDGCGDGRPERLRFDLEAIPGSVAPMYGAEARATILEINGPPIALFDVDGDEDLDLYLGQGNTIDRALAGKPGKSDQLFLNDGRGGFSDATTAWSLDQRGWSQGIAIGDYDGDGDRDVYVTNWGGNALLRNDGGRFTDVTDEAGVGDERWGTSAAFGDIDGDGDADLYVANYLRFDVRNLPTPNGAMPCRWKGQRVSCGPEGLVAQPDVLYLNRGDGTFENASKRVRTNKPGYGLGVLMADLDDDRDLDLLVANDSTPNFYFVNDGRGQFEEQAMFAGLSHSGDGEEQAGMGIALGDPDGDGRPDVVMTHFSEDYHTLYRNLGGGLFADASFRAGLAAVSLTRLGWGTVFADFDLDGDEDLFVAHGHVYPQADELAPRSGYAQRDHLYLNDGSGKLAESGVGAGLEGKHVSRAVAAGDVDGDGDVDLVLQRLGEPPVLVRNSGVRARRSLTVALDGGPGNPDGVGARVQVTAGDSSQSRWLIAGGSFQAVSTPRAHFGLGATAGPVRVVIRWPDGRSDQVETSEQHVEFTRRTVSAAQEPQPAGP